MIDEGALLRKISLEKSNICMRFTIEMSKQIIYEKEKALLEEDLEKMREKLEKSLPRNENFLKDFIKMEHQLEENKLAIQDLENQLEESNLPPPDVIDILNIDGEFSPTVRKTSLEISFKSLIDTIHRDRERMSVATITSFLMFR